MHRHIDPRNHEDPSGSLPKNITGYATGGKSSKGVQRCTKVYVFDFFLTGHLQKKFICHRHSTISRHSMRLWHFCQSKDISFTMKQPSPNCLKASPSRLGGCASGVYFFSVFERPSCRGLHVHAHGRLLGRLRLFLGSVPRSGRFLGSGTVSTLEDAGESRSLLPHTCDRDSRQFLAKTNIQPRSASRAVPATAVGWP